MSRRYWVMRTDPAKPEYFAGEVRYGRMRQGWGYREDLDLAKLADLIRLDKTLCPEQRVAWRNRRLLPSEADGIHEGDIVLLPNLPKQGRWFVAEVTDDEYRYEISREFCDYGHIRNVRLLNLQSPVNPYDEAVSASLRGTMRSQHRLWNIDHHETDVRKLLEAIEEGRSVDQAQGKDEKLESAKEAVKEYLWEQLQHHFRGQEFERPCGRLLEQLYPVVNYTAGRGEHGADFICSLPFDPLGVQHSVAVQLKMWTDELGDDLNEALEQVKRAHLHYSGVTSAVIITTLKDIGDQARHDKEILSEELGIPIQVVLRDDLLDLFLRHLPEMSAALEDHRPA